MTAGVPGTGVGGLFYLAAALLLPVRGVILQARGVQVSWPTILRQTRLALGVAFGIWVMGWLIGFILGPIGRAEATAPATVLAHPQFQNALRWAALLAGFVTLALVLFAVQVARLLTRTRTR